MAVADGENLDIPEPTVAGRRRTELSTDPAEKLDRMRQDLGLTFVNLMDPGSETIKRYGVLNEADGTIPHPTALVVDKDGVVAFVSRRTTL